MTESSRFNFNAADCCKIAGISRVSFQEYHTEPKYSEGRSNFYDVREVVAERLARMQRSNGSSSLSTEKSKLTSVQTRRAEIELMEEEGEIIRVDTVIPLWTDIASSLKAKFLALPRRIQAIFSHVPGIESKSKEMIIEILQELERDDIQEWIDQYKISENENKKENPKKSKPTRQNRKRT